MFYVKKDNEIVLVDNSRDKITNTLKFMPQYQGFEILEADETMVEEWKAKQIKQSRIEELHRLLSEADYWTSKHADGEYTDEEWAEKVATRKAWREELRELEKDNG